MSFEKCAQPRLIDKNILRFYNGVKDAVDLGTALADFARHPHVRLAFVSPSGTSPKPIVPIAPIPQNWREHETAFDAVLEVFSEYVDLDPLDLPTQRDVTRLCFLAHDPRAIDNPAYPPIEIKAAGFLTFGADVWYRVGFEAEELPKIWTQPWNPLTQLQTALDHYPYDPNAQIDYKNDYYLSGDGVISFVCPPQLHPTVKRLVAMGETLSAPHLKRAFPGVGIEVIKPEPAEWVDRAQAFQISTSVYPRRSLLEIEERDGKWAVTGVTKITKRFLSTMAMEKRACAIITFKVLVEKHSDLFDGIPNLKNIGNWEVAEGLNFDGCEVIFVLGSPEVPQHAVEYYSKILYGTDQKPLNFTKNERVYTDPRVQDVYERLVVDKQLQAVGRGRLNRHPKTVVLLSAIKLDGFTEHACLFQIEDWEDAGGLEGMADMVQKRRQTEAEQAIEAGDVKGVAEKARVSVRTARRKTEIARKDKKATLRDLVINLHKQGISKKGISEATSISRRTVKRLLNDFWTNDQRAI